MRVSVSVCMDARACIFSVRGCSEISVDCSMYIKLISSFNLSVHIKLFSSYNDAEYGIPRRLSFSFSKIDVSNFESGVTYLAE